MGVISSQYFLRHFGDSQDCATALSLLPRASPIQV
jgi:hypothetical protein